MFAHAIDNDFSYQIALAETAASTITADAGSPHLAPAVGHSISPASDWKVAQVVGVEGLCFVRRGAGDWNGVITVCDGRVAPLGEVQRPALEPAVFHAAAAASTVGSTSWINSFRAAPSTSAVSLAWQRGFAYVLLAIGLGLAMKSGSMLLQASRKYG